ASWSLPISTKANPRGRPVSRSITTFTSTTFLPPSAKTSRSSGSVTLYDKFPTYSLVPISFSFVLSHGFALGACSSILGTNLHSVLMRDRKGCDLRARTERDQRWLWPHARPARVLNVGAAGRQLHLGATDGGTEHART